MAIVNTAKANAMIRLIASDLALRIANSAAGYVNVVRQAVDTDGYPCLFLSRNGNEAAGQPVIFIRIKQIDAVSKDVFGNSENAYAPHLMDVAYELTAGGFIIPKSEDIFSVLWECIPEGVSLNQIAIANGTAVTVANVNAATPLQTLDWLRWPTKGV
jgi:hypothetical protein